MDTGVASRLSAEAEADRLQALLEYEILDSPADKTFDELTQLAASICQAPISLVSLVDDCRQWFKSKVGLDVSETPREMAFCAHALGQPDELLVVNDALQDPRFAESELVLGPPHIRFYAGAPLVVSSGQVLGTLCVIDQRPRELSAEQLENLRLLARQVVALLEFQRTLKRLKKSAVELQQERRESQLIFDSAPCFMLYKDTEDRILRANRPCAASLGLELHQVEGKRAEEVFGVDAERYYQEDLKVISTGKPRLGFVFEAEVAGAGMRWLNADIIPITDTEGEVKKLLVVATDITELKRTEESLLQSQAKLAEFNEKLARRLEKQSVELAESEARYEDLYHNAPDMFLSVDMATRSILRCNKTFLEEFGYQEEELIGEDVIMLYAPSMLSRVPEVVAELQKTGEVRDHELTLVRKDGSPIEISLNISVIRDSLGRIVTTRGILRDITTVKRLQNESKAHLEQLAHLSRVATMNEMATGIAHELNQPLQAIKNYAEGALMRLQRKTFDAVSLAPLFEEIVADADRAADLITSIRRFVKPSNRHSEQIEPRQIVADVKRLLARELKDNFIKVEVNAPDILPSIQCDPVQIRQVLVNLLLNAIEAFSGSAASQRKVQIAFEQTKEDRIRFAVSDSGKGVEPGELPKLFETFYTTKDSGLGMGLPICRTIIEAHGGRLTVRENDGPGLTFEFDLPIAKND